MKKKIGVIFGGMSVEHEISIITALQAIENLDQEKYEVLPIYIAKDGFWYADYKLADMEVHKNDFKTLKLPQVNLINDNNKYFIRRTKLSLFKNDLFELDMVFPIVHGTNVEDGKLQGYLETINIPYAGSTALSATLGQDKAVMKDILMSHNINQTKFLIGYKSSNINDFVSEIESELGCDVIIKPAELGSSIGIGVANNREEIKDKLKVAFSFSNKVVVEELCTNFKEINISVIGNHKKQKYSVTEEVSKSDEILSYEDKYLSGSKNTKNSDQGMASLARIIPANVDQDLTSKINDVAIKTFKTLNCSGLIRIDLMIVDNEVLVNEVNNIPGSLSFYLWEATGYKYSEILDEVIELGIDYHFEKQATEFTINTNVLNMKGSKSK